MSKDGLHKAIREARDKTQARKKHKKVVYRAPKKDFKKEKRDDGEPTTSALEKWTPVEFLSEFTHLAEQYYPGYHKGVAIHELKSVKEFMNMMSDACPRSILLVIREVARRLVRYKKSWGVAKPPGAWFLLTYGTNILEDLKHLIYDEASLRYIMTEDIDPGMLEITSNDECWVFAWNGEQVQLHKSRTKSVTNPQLLQKLGQAPKERTPDNENFSGW